MVDFGRSSARAWLPVALIAATLSLAGCSPPESSPLTASERDDICRTLRPSVVIVAASAVYAPIYLYRKFDAALPGGTAHPAPRLFLPRAQRVRRPPRGLLLRAEGDAHPEARRTARGHRLPEAGRSLGAARHGQAAEGDRADRAVLRGSGCESRVPQLRRADRPARRHPDHHDPAVLSSRSRASGPAELDRGVEVRRARLPLAVGETTRHAGWSRRAARPSWRPWRTERRGSTADRRPAPRNRPRDSTRPSVRARAARRAARAGTGSAARYSISWRAMSVTVSAPGRPSRIGHRVVALDAGVVRPRTRRCAPPRRGGASRRC